MRVFTCKMCGRCCEGRGGIVLSPKDLVRIAGHLGLCHADFRARYAEPRGGKLTIRSGDDGYCVFFKAGEGCTVHSGRPDVCRAWPFFRGNLVDEISLRMAAADCPGIRLEAGFAEFCRQGFEYLSGHGLVADEDDPLAANTLKLKK